MFNTAPIAASDKSTLYAELAQSLQALLNGERNLVANAANFAALVWHSLPDLNWCGFYLFDGNELVVGPFQGQPACVRIPLGKGVCGTAALTRMTQIVPDVQAFDGHIACDSASRSELVVPLVSGERLLGVWDVDSPSPARFDGDDGEGMERLCAIFIASLDATKDTAEESA
ncbi:MAG: GAF domain-containing protein [Rhodanobacteraceae bacterium]